MFRCVTVTALVFSAISFAAAPAAAQTLGEQAYLKRNFPANALRGEIRFLNPPDIELNGQPTQLSPGSRVRHLNNMVVLSGNLTGQQAKVNYTVDDITHQVRDIWILRPDEAAATPWPRTLEQAQSWQFDLLNQRWTKP